MRGDAGGALQRDPCLHRRRWLEFFLSLCVTVQMYVKVNDALLEPMENRKQKKINPTLTPPRVLVTQYTRLRYLLLLLLLLLLLRLICKFLQSRTQDLDFPLHRQRTLRTEDQPQ